MTTFYHNNTLSIIKTLEGIIYLVHGDEVWINNKRFTVNNRVFDVISNHMRIYISEG